MFHLFRAADPSREEIVEITRRNDAALDALRGAVRALLAERNRCGLEDGTERGPSP